MRKFKYNKEQLNITSTEYNLIRYDSFLLFIYLNKKKRKTISALSSL